jgi:Protein of unknown function (DUF2934)
VSILEQTAFPAEEKIYLQMLSDPAKALQLFRRDERISKEMTMEHIQEHKNESPMQQAKSTQLRKPAEEEIRSRAYQIYISRNRTPGHAMEDWLQAEREVRNRN